MSIKRSRQSSRLRSHHDDESPTFGAAAPKPAEPEKSWAELVAGHADDAFVPYALTRRFDKGALLSHPTFGRGLVVAVSGRRIDVQFEAGKKTLGHAG